MHIVGVSSPFGAVGIDTAIRQDGISFGKLTKLIVGLHNRSVIKSDKNNKDKSLQQFSDDTLESHTKWAILSSFSMQKRKDKK
ncbi:MAG: hypothetical protein RLZZ210_188 [Pseudomonadota bacterium]